MKGPKPEKGLCFSDVYDWHKCIDYIENKYKIDVRDYLRKYSCERTKEEYKTIPYQDFWHWIVKNKEIHNGCFFDLCKDDRECMTNWQKEIMDIIFKEFGNKEENFIKFWVEW